MRVVDTSAWIEWLIDFATGSMIEAQLPPRSEGLVPTIVQLELAKWLTREVKAAHLASCGAKTAHLSEADARIRPPAKPAGEISVGRLSG